LCLFSSPISCRIFFLFSETTIRSFLIDLTTNYFITTAPASTSKITLSIILSSPEFLLNLRFKHLNQKLEPPLAKKMHLHHPDILL
jgi:hypothetical protein